MTIQLKVVPCIGAELQAMSASGQKQTYAVREPMSAMGNSGLMHRSKQPPIRLLRRRAQGPSGER